MNNTGTDKLSQVCESLQAALRWQAGLIVDNFDALPEAQRYELCRLGSAMWVQVQSIQTATQMVVVEADAGYQSFKSALLCKVSNSGRRRSNLGTQSRLTRYG